MEKTLLLQKSKKLFVRIPETSSPPAILHQLAASAQTEDRRRALRLLFVRHSYFRPWSKIPILTSYWLSNLEGRERQLEASLSFAQQGAGPQIALAVQKLLPLIQEEFLNPLMSFAAQQEKKGVKVEELTEADFLAATIARFQGGALGDMLVGALNRLGTDAFLLGATLSRSFYGSILSTIVQRSRMLLNELGVSENDSADFYKSLVEMSTMKPVAGLLWCMNSTCQHVEVILSDRLTRFDRCPKCHEPALFVTVLVMDPALSELKMHDCDLSTFLTFFARLSSQTDLLEGQLVPSLEAYANVFVRSFPRGQEREVDVLLYSPFSRKCCVIECKVHEDAQKILPDTLESVCTKDLTQLHDILRATGIGVGGYVTNHHLRESDVEHIQDKILPKVGLHMKRTYILPFTNEQAFLAKFERLLRVVDPRARIPSTSG